MIELLPTTGCTGEELISKINEIIAVVNSMSNVTSYSQLTDKPSINGVTLVGNKSTAQMQISMAGLSDYSSQMSAIATKTEVQNAQAAATQAATAAVQEQIAGKMDKNPTATSEVQMLSDDAYVYIYGDGTLKKIKMSNLTRNVELKMTSDDAIAKAVNQGVQMFTLSGTQDGSNKVFTTLAAFSPATTNLFLNGQRLTLGADYEETTNKSITFVTAPASTDTIVLTAVPR